MVLDKIEITLKDMYQLLVTECRYGYTRLNHLMPDGAYDRVKKMLPLMLAIDKDFALSTAKQLAEECISDNLVRNFYDGLDDEFQNRAAAIKFIEWLFEFIKKDELEWIPYNYNNYLDNLKHDDDKVYNVYEILDGDKEKLIAGPLSIKEYQDFIFNQVLDNTSECTYHKIRLNKHCEHHGSYSIRFPLSFKYEFITPVQRTFIIEHICYKQR